MHRRHFLIRSSQTAIALGILPRLAACKGDSAPTGEDAPFIAVRDRYFLKALELNPVTATYLGGDGYDPSLARVSGRLRDWRPEALAAERQFYQEIDTARMKIDPATLSPQARIDHAVLGAQIAFLLHQSGDLRTHERIVDTYVAEPFRGIDWQIQGMTDIPSGGGAGDSGKGGAAAPLPASMRGSEEEWGLVVERLSAMPAYLDTARANLLEGKKHNNQPDHRMVERDGVTGAKANAEYFRKTLPALAKGYLGSRPFAPATLAQLSSAAGAAADAWEGFAGFLLSTYDPQDLADRFAAGEREYAWRLKNCLRVDRNLEDLYAYAAQEVTRYERQLFEVAEEVAKAQGLNLPWSADADRRSSARIVMDALSKDSPKNDDELFQWYRDAGARAVAYGREQKLFDIPADYQLEVTPTPPVLRASIDAAYYPAPPFKKAGAGRFYLSPTGNDPAALKLNNRASVADTAIHEGFPGHDWYYRFLNQYASEISNIRWLTPGAVEDSSSMWQDSMASEGWGLYAEELMAEPAADHPHGFYTAAEHLYELQGQLLRAVRVRVDVGIHTGRMSFDRGGRLLHRTRRVLSRGRRPRPPRIPTAAAIAASAQRAIYRYSKWPTQAITYNLGKGAIIALRDALRAKQGSQFSARAFHERLMRMGAIPAGYFRDWFLAS